MYCKPRKLLAHQPQNQNQAFLRSTTVHPKPTWETCALWQAGIAQPVEVVVDVVSDNDVEDRLLIMFLLVCGRRLCVAGASVVP